MAGHACAHPLLGPLAAASHDCARHLSGPLAAASNACARSLLGPSRRSKSRLCTPSVRPSHGGVISGLCPASASALGCYASGFVVVTPSATPASLRPATPSAGKVRHLRLAIFPDRDHDRNNDNASTTANVTKTTRQRRHHHDNNCNNDYTTTTAATRQRPQHLRHNDYGHDDDNVIVTTTQPTPRSRQRQRDRNNDGHNSGDVTKQCDHDSRNYHDCINDDATTTMSTSTFNTHAWLTLATASWHAVRAWSVRRHNSKSLHRYTVPT